MLAQREVENQAECYEEIPLELQHQEVVTNSLRAQPFEMSVTRHIAKHSAAGKQNGGNNKQT
jgi:hypothetical protein